MDRSSATARGAHSIGNAQNQHGRQYLVPKSSDTHFVRLRPPSPCTAISQHIHIVPLDGDEGGTRTMIAAKSGCVCVTIGASRQLVATDVRGPHSQPCCR